MDRDDLELFERSLQHVAERHTGAALDAALDELGWGDALTTDPEAAIATLFELQGRANATSSALAAVVLEGLGMDPGQGLVLPAFGRASAPGVFDGSQVTVNGLATGTALGAPKMVVVAAHDGSHVAVTVATGALSVRAIGGLDPSLGLAEITGVAPASDAIPVDWSTAVGRAQLAVGHELIGASRAMLDLARAHAIERIQFDRPIASFQAIRHRLAETLVAIETAQSMADAAWEDGEPLTSAMAKALAGRGARTTARHAQQVLAGIGFTLEHRFHHYFRRILVLDELFGSARVLTRSLGEDVIRTRQLPPVAPL